MKKLLKFTGISITVMIAITYIISCLTPYISPVDFPFGTLLSIAYLPILIVYFLLILTWCFIRRKIAGLLLILLFAGLTNLKSTFGLNAFSPSWKWARDSNTIRLMCWNVNFLGDPYIANDTANNVRRKMLAYISEVQPDILCMQDFYSLEEGTVKNVFHNNLDAVDSAGNFLSQYYPFTYEYNGYNYSVKSGVVFFSKFPIADTGSFDKNILIKDEKAGYIEINVREKPLRIYAAHFSSMGLWPNVSGEGGLSYFKGDSTQKRTSTILSKLRHYGKMHAREAEAIKAELNKSPHPFLISADMNAVPSSYTYHTLKKGLNDAFLEKDFGIGGTYNLVFPKIRIDVLLHSKEIEVVQYKRPAVKLSDHYPIIADIRWK
jgi:endonuclease/exonuclease/phosphatase family metal-dependent hydrolase